MRVMLLVVILALLAGCGPTPTPTVTPLPTATPEPTITVTPVPTETPVPTPRPTCTELSTSFVTNVENLLRRWDDADQVAGATPRMSLAGPVSDLQALKREAENLEVLDCAKPVKVYLVNYMDSTVSAYLDFMTCTSGDTCDLLVRMSLELASDEKVSLDRALSNLKNGRAPYNVIP